MKALKELSLSIATSVERAEWYRREAERQQQQREALEALVLFDLTPEEYAAMRRDALASGVGAAYFRRREQ